MPLKSYLIDAPPIPVTVDFGGTGITSYAVGDLIYASASTTLSKLAGVATGNVLLSGGIATAPAWGQVGLTTHVTGTLPVANGGTGVASLTAGSIEYGAGTSAHAALAIGAANTVLTSSGTAPQWSTSLTLAGSIDNTSASGVTTRAAATQDALQIIGRAGGTSSYIGTLIPGTLTASRTYTLPDATTTVAGLAVTQTFSAAQTFSSGITVTGAITNNQSSGNYLKCRRSDFAAFDFGVSDNETWRLQSQGAASQTLVIQNVTGGIATTKLSLTATAVTLGSSVTSGLTIAATTGTTLTVSSTQAGTGGGGSTDGAAYIGGALSIGASGGVALSVPAGVAIRNADATGMSTFYADVSILNVRRGDGGGAGQLTCGNALLTGGAGSVSLQQTTGLAWRCTTANATDTIFIDFPRIYWRDPSNSFSNQINIENGAITIPTTTGTTLTVSSTDNAAISCSGGAFLTTQLVVVADPGGTAAIRTTGQILCAGACTIANGFILAYQASAGSGALDVRVGGDSVGRFTALAGGTLSWSDGSSAVDTNLYRSAANTLKTDDAFVIGQTTGTTLTVSSTSANAISCAGGITSTSATAGIGYATGAGGTVTQITSRTTAVTLNTVCGDITLVSAAGSTSWQSFTVTNSAVAATDKVDVCQVSGTDLNLIHVTNIASGSFQITFATTGGTTTEQPVFRFSVIKGVTS